MKITKAHREVAAEVKRLSDTFGHLPFNAFGQTTNEVCNLAVPMSYFVTQGMVTAVDESCEWECLAPHVVDDVRKHCTLAVEYATAQHGRGWWNEQDLGA